MEEKEEQILILWAKVAEKKLAKMADIDSFINISDINLKWDDTIENLGNWCTSERTISINENFLNDILSGDKDKEELLLTTLQHELIHAFIGIDENFKINTSTDASPVHQTVITFFNARGCNISSNGSLTEIFKLRQRNLYDLAINLNTTFNQLYEKINQWQLQLQKELDKYTQANTLDKVAESIMNNEKCEELKDIISFFHESCEISYVEGWKINEFRYGELVYNIKQYKINLGMDCNLEKFEEFINKLINDYVSKIEVD